MMVLQEKEPLVPCADFQSSYSLNTKSPMPTVSRTLTRTLVPPLALALAALPTLPARAEQSQQQPSGEAAASLPDITVKARRLYDPRTDVGANDAALGATTLGGAQLAPLRAASSDSASLLSGVPGVSLNGAGGVSSLPAIHGLADERLRIQLDDMDFLAACANHMNPLLSYIDPAQVERIRVFAGATPVSVGGDSIGGTIQVESALPEFAQPGQPPLVNGSLGGGWRSNGRGYHGNAAASYATEQLQLRYEGAAAQADNYRAARAFKPPALDSQPGPTLAANEVGSSGFRTQNHKLGAAWRQDMHLLQADLGWQDIGFQGFPNQRMDMTSNQSTQFNLRYRGQLDWGDLQLRGFNHHVRHTMDMGKDRYDYGTGMPMNTNATTRGAAIQANWLTSERDTVRLGAEAQQYTLYDWWPPVGDSGAMAPNIFWNIDHGRRHKASAFAEWERRWDQRWTTLIGLRHARVMTDADPVQGYNNLPAWADDAAAFNALQRRRHDRNWDFSAITSFSPQAGQTFQAGLDRKTRSPSLYQRYPWSTNTMAIGMNNFLGDGNGYLGNPDLKPEVAYTASLSGEWLQPGDDPDWGFKADAHMTRVENYIDAVRCSDTLCKSGNSAARDQFVMLRYANQDARLWGLDLAGHWVLAKSDRLGRFTLTGTLSWLRGKNLSTGDSLYNTMPPNFRLSLEHRIALGEGRLSTALDWQGVTAKTHVSQVRNEIPTPGYGLLGLRASHEVKQLRLDAGVENLLNKAYALPLGGAYLGQGSSMMLNSLPWGVAVPGRGRTFYAAATLKF